MGIVYNRTTKTFSPSYSRSKFINHTKKFSDEFIHNCIRLIVRPNHSSAKHWFNEILPWIDFALTMPIECKDRPMTPLFEYVLDKGSTNDDPKWVDDFISTLFILVCKEPYGKFNIELDSDKVCELLKTLYQILLEYRYSKLTKVDTKHILSKWYHTIPLAKLDL